MSRVTRSKGVARAFYNKLGPSYDLLAGTSERKFTEIGLELLNVAEGETVLEIGYGTGWSLLKLAQSVGKHGRVYGIDISRGMYKIAASRLRKAGWQARVNLRCGDASQLPYQTSMFNAIFLSFTLELFDTPEIPVILLECQRVLRKNGRIGLVALSKKQTDNFPTLLYEWIHNKLPNYIDCRPICATEMLENVNFQIVTTIEKKMWGLPVDAVLGTIQKN